MHFSTTEVLRPPIVKSAMPKRMEADSSHNIRKSGDSMPEKYLYKPRGPNQNSWRKQRNNAASRESSLSSTPSDLQCHTEEKEVQTSPRFTQPLSSPCVMKESVPTTAQSSGIIPPTARDELPDVNRGTVVAIQMPSSLADKARRMRQKESLLADFVADARLKQEAVCDKPSQQRSTENTDGKMYSAAVAAGSHMPTQARLFMSPPNLVPSRAPGENRGNKQIRRPLQPTLSGTRFVTPGNQSVISDDIVQTNKEGSSSPITIESSPTVQRMDISSPHLQAYSQKPRLPSRLVSGQPALYHRPGVPVSFSDTLSPSPIKLTSNQTPTMVNKMGSGSSASASAADYAPSPSVYGIPTGNETNTSVVIREMDENEFQRVVRGGGN